MIPARPPGWVHHGDVRLGTLKGWQVTEPGASACPPRDDWTVQSTAAAPDRPLGTPVRTLGILAPALAVALLGLADIVLENLSLIHI